MYFMALKGDSFAKIQFVSSTMVQSCNVTGFTLRSDNGVEYNLGKVQIFIKNKNLHSNFTSPHSPHQNGAAERYWRCIFDNARALLLTSKLRQPFWVGAVDTVVYTSNRALLSAFKDDKTL